MNPFQTIPAEARKWLYLAYGLVGLILGCVAAYCAAVGTVAPEWVGGASAVLVVVGSAFGFTAASNVQDPAIGDQVRIEVDGRKVAEATVQSKPDKVWDWDNGGVR